MRLSWARQSLKSVSHLMQENLKLGARSAFSSRAYSFSNSSGSCTELNINSESPGLEVGWCSHQLHGNWVSCNKPTKRTATKNFGTLFPFRPYCLKEFLIAPVPCPHSWMLKLSAERQAGISPFGLLQAAGNASVAEMMFLNPPLA